MIFSNHLNEPDELSIQQLQIFSWDPPPGMSGITHLMDLIKVDNDFRCYGNYHIKAEAPSVGRALVFLELDGSANMIGGEPCYPALFQRAA